ncbi:hypothetical protein PV04_04597 [Phialophora macrospora]|uniref:Telomeric single stranded DNA binding POT1/Cdc13 domain-containing protein n=1 Tax=Phialophora macrospora TaxID=1851006 RepID=A0A0D2FQ04_9EURO|nr:hypothetical protein PV04_04597 [Phialophora macrospora]
MTTVALTLETSKQIPIADLSPTSDDASSYFLAHVALVWPYSSSTGTLALLLADTDIRRRKSKGQVKVVFHHGCAREVARTKVGIGDTVKLALVGCKWTETGDLVSTPGKKIDWDLEYWRRVTLQVHRDGDLHSTVDYRANESDASSAGSTIALVNGTYAARPSVNGVLHRQPSTIHVPYLTPQKPFRRISAGTFIDAALDSFDEGDGYVPGRGRKRTKFARNSGAWSLVDADEESRDISKPTLDAEPLEQQPTDPREEVNLTVEPAEPTEQDQVQDEEVEHIRPEEEAADIIQTPESDVVEIASTPPLINSMGSPSVPQAVAMGPPSTPLKAIRLHPPQDEGQTPQVSSTSDALTTPRLLPLASPGLPLVSPLIQRAGVEVGYFPTFDETASQLDASGDKEAAISTGEAKPANELDAASSGSEDSLMVIEQVSALKRPSEDINAEPVGRSEHMEAIDQVPIDTEKAVSTSVARYQEPQWLSSLESKIDEERLRSDNRALSEINAQLPSPLKVVEDEDDDMYGAPADMPQANEPEAILSSVEPPKSPLDVLEQFLQMSPVAHTSPSNGFESRDVGNTPIFPITPLQQRSVPGSVAMDFRQEKTSDTVFEKHSPVTYPESQSPFRQNRGHQTSSSTSSRRSSDHHTGLRSLDGTLDIQEPFADYIHHLAQIAATAESVQQPTTESELAQGAPQRVVSPEVEAPPASILSSAGVAEEVIPPTLEKVELVAAQAANPLPPTQPTSLDDQKADVFTQTESSQRDEAQVQLLTPDQSQLYQPLPGAETRLEQTETTEVIDIALPTPQHTQEEAAQQKFTEEVVAQDSNEEGWEESGETDSTQQEEVTAQVIAELQGQLQENESTDPLLEAPAQAAREMTPEVVAGEEEGPVEELAASATPGMASTTPDLQPNAVTPRRISQRLSARKSTMASNISSPYFTPRKPAPAPSSSPTRKENIRPASPDRSSLRLSPVQARGKTPVPSVLLQEVEQNGIDITPVSPNLQAKRSISRRHTGITTPLAYYAHLSSLHEHFGQVVDIIAACTESSPPPQRSKSGPKDYHTTLRLADPSLPSDRHAAVPAQIFRHAMNAIPATTDGDVVILRNFKVQTSERKFILLSTETSSWAVFQAKLDSTMSWSDVIISGPPIEYGPAETSRVKLLFSWWNSGGKGQFSPSTLTNDHQEMEIGPSELRSRSPRIKDHAQPLLKAQPASGRRIANMTSDFGNENAVENFYASFANADDIGATEAAFVVSEVPANGGGANMNGDAAKEAEIDVQLAQRTTRRKANRTDHVAHEEDDDVNIIDYAREKSAPLTDATNHRRQSTVSTTASEPGRTFTPRRSARQKHKKSPSLVHELRDGTKYVDDDPRRSASVVHELRDGVTYVD